jgi:hypothetical protein
MSLIAWVSAGQTHITSLHFTVPEVLTVQAAVRTSAESYIAAIKSP